MIITNECRYTVDELKEDLEELGLIIPNNCYFYTAGLSAKDYLEEKLNRFKNKKIIVGIVGELGLYTVINSLNNYSNFILKDFLDNDYIINNNTTLYLIIGTVNKIKINHLNKILKWVKKGAKIITTCIDTCDPSSKGDFTLGMASHMLHMVGYNLKTKSYSTGKPHPMFKKKILFVGDTIYTDIRLAEESGFKSCLVLSGNSNIDTLKSYVTEPDYVINNISELFNIL
jgi:NagD protein